MRAILLHCYSGYSTIQLANYLSIHVVDLFIYILSFATTVHNGVPLIMLRSLKHEVEFNHEIPCAG